MSTLAFDDVPRTNRTLDATQRIARVLDESGINARASLYDEALHLAKEGHLSQATERLRCPHHGLRGRWTYPVSVGVCAPTSAGTNHWSIDRRPAGH